MTDAQNPTYIPSIQTKANPYIVALVVLVVLAGVVTAIVWFVGPIVVAAMLTIAFAVLLTGTLVAGALRWTRSS